jgi:hypothetical protein
MRAALDAEADELSKLVEHQTNRSTSLTSDRDAMARKRGASR